VKTYILVLVVEVNVGIFIIIERDKGRGKGGETGVVWRMGLHVFFREVLGNDFEAFQEIILF
jgi:hypothetical protein